LGVDCVLLRLTRVCAAASLRCAFGRWKFRIPSCLDPATELLVVPACEMRKLDRSTPLVPPKHLNFSVRQRLIRFKQTEFEFWRIFMGGFNVDASAVVGAPLLPKFCACADMHKLEMVGSHIWASPLPCMIL
jgi:hypothetical protein